MDGLSGNQLWSLAITRNGDLLAGHHGDAHVTTLGLRIEKIDAEKNLLYVRGSVPGHPDALVRIRPAVRGS